jgi:hypothetical protein
MPALTTRFGLSTGRSPVLATLAKHGTIALTNGGDLLRLSRRPAEDLRGLNLNDQEIGTVHAFGSIASVFPAAVALALVDSGIGKIEDLRDLTPERLRRALQSAGISPEEIATEAERLKAWQSSPATQPRPTGLVLDLGPSALSNEARKALERAGVATLSDWVDARDRLEIPQQDADLIDAHARLRGVGLWGEQSAALIKQQITTAVELARLDDGSIKPLARKTGLDETALRAAAERARLRLDTIDRVLREARRAPQRPAWLRTLPDVVREAAEHPVCEECLDELSAFSRFAYFLYLVARTGKTLAELESIFHQGFAALSADSDRERVPQVTICQQVLGKVYPGPIQFAENMLYMRRGMVARFGGVAITLAQFEAAAHQSAPQIDAADLRDRVAQALRAALLDPTPAFTEAELALVDNVLLAQLETEIAAEPAFNGAPANTIRDEAVSRLTVRTDAVRPELDLLRRETFKARAGKNDAQLFAELYIETNLGSCERMTRLDQAIFSLQAYLDAILPASPPPYLGYAAWRGDRMQSLYPELRALWRDDVLIGELDPWDRGSLVRGSAQNAKPLRDALKAAEDALKAAKFTTASGTISDSAFDAASRLIDQPEWNNFEAGFAAIDTVLDADAALQQAAGNLDDDEANLALDAINEAEAKLDDLARQIFSPDSTWFDLLGTGPNLIDRPPATRQLNLSGLFWTLLNDRKSIFSAAANPVALEGLLEDGTIDLTSPAWAADGAFHDVDGQIAADGVRDGSSSKRAIR